MPQFPDTFGQVGDNGRIDGLSLDEPLEEPGDVCGDVRVGPVVVGQGSCQGHEGIVDVTQRRFVVACAESLEERDSREHDAGVRRRDRLSVVAQVGDAVRDR